jgi:ribonuclease VapC
MVVDTSAVVAIFLGEPERREFLDLIQAAGVRLISAAGAFEAGLVLESRKGETMGQELDLFLTRMHFEIVPFDADQLVIARQAFGRFGKGHHPAGLNFGDCFAYALAKFSGEPLLAKGNDFIRTDIPLCGTWP